MTGSTCQPRSRRHTTAHCRRQEATTIDDTFAERSGEFGCSTHRGLQVIEGRVTAVVARSAVRAPATTPLGHACLEGEHHGGSPRLSDMICVRRVRADRPPKHSSNGPTDNATAGMTIGCGPQIQAGDLDGTPKEASTRPISSPFRRSRSCCRDVTFRYCRFPTGGLRGSRDVRLGFVERSSPHRHLTR